MFSGQFGNSGPLGLQLLQLGGDASRKLWVALFSQLLSSLVNVVHVLLQRLNVISQRLRSPKSKAITLVFDKNRPQFTYKIYKAMQSEGSSAICQAICGVCQPCLALRVYQLKKKVQIWLA